MRALLQRVSEASVSVADDRVAGIGRGLLVFLGVEPGDGGSEIVWLADKILGLRIFPGDDKPMNRSVKDVGGGVLVVSQFTLAADTSRGKRPSFSSAAPPEVAEALYLRFVEEMRSRHAPVEAGVFGAEMQVGLVNDGPVTFLLERRAHSE
jgi:D-tyrosyl-tRNA(Tyr) deacylase